MFKSLIYQIFEKLLRFGLGIYTVGLIANYLQPSEFGRLNYIISLVTILSCILVGPINSLFLTEYKKNGKSAIAIFFRVKIVLFTNYIIICSLVYFLHLDDILFLIYSTSMIFTLIDVNVTLLIYENKGKILSYVRSVVLLVFTALKIYIVYNNLGLNSIVLVMSLELVLTHAIFLYFKPVSYFCNRVEFVDIRNILKRLMPLILSSGLIVIYNKLDRLMINYYLGDAATGIYSVGVAIPESLGVILSILVINFFSKANSSHDFEIWIKRNIYILGFAIVVGAPFAALLSKKIIQIIYGVEYISASGVLTVSYISIVLSYLVLATSNVLIFYNLEKYRLYRAVQSLAINIALNYILIPIYGIIGAAIATLVSQLYALTLGYALNKQTRFIIMIIIQSFTEQIKSDINELRK